MINAICENATLMRFFSSVISENGVKVFLDPDFYDEDGDINIEKIINIAVDNYYNSLGLADTPPSIDNLLVIGRGNQKYSIYLVELKDVSKLRRIDTENIKKKFNTTINDFMKDRFADEFNIEATRIVDLNCWLVSNRFMFMGYEISEEEYQKKIKSTVIEKLLLIRPFRFKGKISHIQSMPNGTTIY